MTKLKLIPLMFGFFLLSSCSSQYSSEREAMDACEEWAKQEGQYTINLLMPPDRDLSMIAIYKELGKVYENNMFNAQMAVGNALGAPRDGIYKIALTKRDCQNSAQTFTGVADKFVINGLENKNFKTGEVFTLNVSDYSKLTSAGFIFKPKNLKKFSNKVQDLIEKRSDYKVVKEFEF